MVLGGRLFLKYQYGPDGPEPPPKDPWASWKLTALLLATILLVAGMTWLGLTKPAFAVPVRWVLIGTLSVTSLVVLLTKPRLFFEVFSSRARRHSLLTGSILGEQDSLNEILMQVIMAEMLVAINAVSWMLRTVH